MPHPIGAYGVSKLAGELYARAYLDNALVVRPCGVFGPAGRHTSGGNFPELMLRLANGGKPLRVVNDAIVSPTYAPALAERSAKLLLSFASGVFHIGGGEALTWYEYARLIFQVAGLSPAVEPVDRTTFPTAARRPLYSALSNARMEAACASSSFGFTMTPRKSSARRRESTHTTICGCAAAATAPPAVGPR